MNGQTLRIEVQIKTPWGWETEVFKFTDPEKVRIAKRLIKEELGFEANYLIVNMSSSPLPDGDEEFAASVSTYEKLYRLADDIEFLTPDP